MNVHELWTKWHPDGDTTSKTSRKAADEVSSDERERRLAEHVQCAPNAEFLNALEQGLLDARKTGVRVYVRRDGRGHYAWRVGDGKLITEGTL
jgi:hypothetical protein